MALISSAPSKVSAGSTRPYEKSGWPCPIVKNNGCQYKFEMRKDMKRTYRNTEKDTRKGKRKEEGS